MLVVDDDANTRALIVSLLERIGCEPHEAAAGDEALEVAGGGPAGARDP